MTSPSYRTLEQRVRFEPDKTKGSRHIATVAPIQDATEAAAFVDAARAEFPQANHHAFAYRLGEGGEQFRYSDDGEPSGSAGRPILAQIDGRDLTHTIAVVTRMFGGTKLGVGGLVRAYGGAAAAALDQATIVTRTIVAVIVVHYDYPDEGAVQGVLHAARLAPRSSDYGERVEITLDVPIDQSDGFERAIRDATASRATTSRVGTDPGEASANRQNPS